MVTQLLTPAEVDQSARVRGGLLSQALPAPGGWETGGLTIPFYGCTAPIVRDKCITATDEPAQESVGMFPAIPIEQAVTCGATSAQETRAEHARQRFAATADYALGLQLATDAADTGAPSLADAAVTFTASGPLEAVSCLEGYAAETGYGSLFVLHAPWRAAAWLQRDRLVVGDQRDTPAGGRWVMSSGYPTEAELVTIWLTGQVWASVTVPDLFDSFSHRTNELDGWARGEGVVAFDPCMIAAATFPVPACT